MSEILADIRNAVRAVIVRDGKVLLLEKSTLTGTTRYALPGGGQKAGESVFEALQRECREEIGSEVQIGQLLAMADYFRRREARPDQIRHVMEIWFACQVDANYQPQCGEQPDDNQQLVVWRDIATLQPQQMWPNVVLDVVRQLNENKQIELGYLGAIN